MTQLADVFSNRYEIQRGIARGGMAEVYLARDQLLDRPVAVKVLFAEYARDPSFVERFRRDTSVSARFVFDGHPISLPAPTALELARIVQEALVNVRKHSGAEKVSVVLRSTRTFLGLTVTDDGCGFDPRGDRFGRGGDHSGFNAEGFAAVGFRESKENYSMQHSANDTIDGVSFPYLARNARVNAAALASLALAPAAPVVVNEKGGPLLDRQPSGYDARLRWTASPGAASYRVFWREAWTPDWQHEADFGNVTEVVLPGLSIDEHVFGVAAVGADGQESLVAAYVNPSRPAAVIQTR